MRSQLLLLLLSLSLRLLTIQSGPFDNLHSTSAPSGFWRSLSISSSGNIVYGVIGYGGGVYVSTDGGGSWSLVSSLPTNALWTAISISADASHITAVQSSGAVYGSRTSGASWSVLRALSSSWMDVCISSSGVIQLGVSFAGLVSVSRNSGSSWAPSGSRGNWMSCAVSSDGSRMMAADYGSGGGASIHISTNTGASWSVLAASPTLFWSGLACSDNAAVIAAVSDYAGDIAVSTDGGSSFALHDLPAGDWRGVGISADGQLIAALQSGGGVFLSTDSGLSFAATSAPSLTWAAVAVAYSKSKIILAGNESIFVSYLNDRTPNPVGAPSLASRPAPGGGNVAAVAALCVVIVCLASVAGGVYYSRYFSASRRVPVSTLDDAREEARQPRPSPW